MDISKVVIGQGIFGFPVVHGISEKIQVSISHCDNLCLAIAFPDEHPMAVDLEKEDPTKMETLKKLMLDGEKKYLVVTYYQILWDPS